MPTDIRTWKDPAGMGRTVLKRGLVILGALALLWVIVAAVAGVRFTQQVSAVLGRLAY